MPFDNVGTGQDQAAAGEAPLSEAAGLGGVPAASGVAGQVQPPPSNTGVSSSGPGGTHLTDRCVTFTPHWLTVSIRKPVKDVLALVADHFLGASLGDDPASLFDANGRTRFYSSLLTAANGISVCAGFTVATNARKSILEGTSADPARAKLDSKTDHVLVNIPGQALEVLPGGGLAALCGFLGHLVEWQAGVVDEAPPVDDDNPAPAPGRVFKVTRLDLAFDHVPFTVQQCIEAASDPEARNVRSPVRKGTAHVSLGEREAGEDGDTFEWGARRSKSRVVRCYDRRGFVRFEMEWRGDRSDLLARELADLAPGAWAKRAIAHLRDFIDFIDRESSSNVSRCSLLPWWAAFVQGIDRIRIKIERPARPVVEKVPTWVKRTRKNVHKLASAFGVGYVLHHLVRMGEFALTPADRREVTELRRVAEDDPDSVNLYPSLRQAVDQVAAALLGPPGECQGQLAW